MLACTCGPGNLGDTEQESSLGETASLGSHYVTLIRDTAASVSGRRTG